MDAKKAVVLLSGGLDSATCLAVALSEGFEVTCLSIDYGQRHASELNAARALAEASGVKDHRIVDVNLTAIGGSALTDDTIAVPEQDSGGEIPVTYVPARNTVFLSLALGLAEVLDSVDIFIGVNAVDYSGYPDCRPEFIQAFAALANLATRNGVEGKKTNIHTPLIDLTKAEIIRLGMKTGVDYSLSVSCYQANSEGEACGRCESCRIRQSGFRSAGIADPTRYVQ